MREKHNQRGVSLIAAIFILVILAFMGVMFVSLINTSAFTAINDLQSAQALYIAEGGVESAQLALAQNLDWYRSASDPMSAPTSTTQNLGAGSFAVTTTLPATMLSRRLTVVGGTATVYTSQRFPSAGYLQIENIEGNSEFVHYNATSSTSFTLDVRNATIGSVPSNVFAHKRGDVVYPVTTLITPLASANCAVVPNPFQITYHLKFLSAGTIMVTSGCTLDTCCTAGTGCSPPASVNAEQISFTGATTTGATMTLYGVQRCQNGTPGITAINGDPVTPVQAGVVANIYDYEAEMAATGTVGSAVRAVKKTVPR